VGAHRSEPDTLLVVDLKSDEEQAAQIVTILRDLDIPAERVESSDPAAGPGRLALRVPPARLVAAVLALAHHGFRRARAYGGAGEGNADRPGAAGAPGALGAEADHPSLGGGGGDRE